MENKKIKLIIAITMFILSGIVIHYINGYDTSNIKVPMLLTIGYLCCYISNTK